MNPALLIIILLICIAIWFMASGLYKPLGKWIGGIINDAFSAMKNDNEE